MSAPALQPAAVVPTNPAPAPAATPQTASSTPQPANPVNPPAVPAGGVPTPEPLTNPTGILPAVPRTDAPPSPGMVAATPIEYLGADGQPVRATINELIESHRKGNSAIDDATIKQAQLYAKAMGGDGDALSEYLKEIGFSDSSASTTPNTQPAKVELPDEVKQTIDALKAKVDLSEQYMQQQEDHRNQAAMGHMIKQFEVNVPLTSRMGPDGAAACVARVRQITQEAKANPMAGVNPSNPEHQMRIITKAIADVEQNYREYFVRMGGQIPTNASPAPSLTDDHTKPKAGYVPPSITINGGVPVHNTPPGQIPTGVPGNLPSSAGYAPASVPATPAGPISREQMMAGMTQRLQGAQ